MGILNLHDRRQRIVGALNFNLDAGSERIYGARETSIGALRPNRAVLHPDHVTRLEQRLPVADKAERRVIKPPAVFIPEGITLEQKGAGELGCFDASPIRAARQEKMISDPRSLICAPVSSTSGGAVGESVMPTSVGACVGASVYSGVGRHVGHAVGVIVGIAVGDSVGASVGLSVGAPVGLAVGNSVGVASGRRHSLHTLR